MIVDRFTLLQMTRFHSVLQSPRFNAYLTKDTSLVNLENFDEKWLDFWLKRVKKENLQTLSRNYVNIEWNGKFSRKHPWIYYIFTWKWFSSFWMRSRRKLIPFKFLNPLAKMKIVVKFGLKQIRIKKKYFEADEFRGLLSRP